MKRPPTTLARLLDAEHQAHNADLPEMNDATLQQAIQRLHALANRQRTEAAQLARPGGWQRLYGDPVGVTVPQAIEERLRRWAKAQALRDAERIDASIADLLNEPSDAARRRLSTTKAKAS